MSTVKTQNSSATSLPIERATWGRLWLIGLLAILASEIVNVMLATLAVSLLSVPPSMQLQLPVYSVFTIVGVLGAVLVFALINRLSRRPIQLYRIIATIVLLISFVPDFLLLSAPGAHVSDVAVLIVMHIATFLVTVGMLTTLTRAK
jgi:MFS family permease